jgi:Flp pilus assembly CpaE family ATPase
MGNGERNSVATAIRGAEFEGFVASTLFNEGWNVAVRALDIASLLEYLQSQTVSLILISSDLDGLTSETLNQLIKTGIKVLLFASTENAVEIYPDTYPQPTNALDLLGLIRGSLRSPLLQTSRQERVRAKTIAFASTTSSSGCTTLAMNYSAELSLAGKKTLLVDAHAFSQAIAIRLNQRGLNSAPEPRNIASELWALEVTQENLSEVIVTLDRARREFDFIILDLGVLRDFPATLTGRRWCGETFIWMSHHGDELCIVSKTDPLALDRLRTFAREISRHSIKPAISFIHQPQGISKKSKNGDDPFLMIVTPLKPARILDVPWDTRNVLQAENEGVMLHEANEKGMLRRFIAHSVGELIS